MMLTRRSRTVSVLLASLLAWGAVLALVAPAAQALTFRLTGVIDEITDPYAVLAGRVSLGDPYVAHLTYDPLASPISTSTNPDSALYEWNPSGSDFSISIVLAGITAATDPAGVGRIRVNDLHPASTTTFPDRMQAISPGGSVLATGANVTDLEILLRDWSRTAFSSTALPTSLELSDFDDNYVGLLIQESQLALAFGNVQTLTLVPEPGTATLVLAGLAGLALRGRRLSRSGGRTAS